MRIVGVVVFLMALGIGIGSNPGFMLDIPSICIVCVGTLGMLLLEGSSIPTMFKSVFSSAASEEEIRAGIRAWKMARFYSLGAGIIGGLIGMFIMFKNMDDPAAIGPGMAIALLSSLYGLGLAFGLCLPLQAGLAKRVQTEEDHSVLISVVFAVLIAVPQSAVAFLILLLSIP